jgi:hypothetical protein
MHLPVATAAPVVPPPAGFQTQGPWVAGALYLVVPAGLLAPVPEEAAAEGEAPLWYCITRGKHIGVALHNTLALAAVVGVSRSSMKSYKTQALAVSVFNDMLTYNLIQVL